MEDTKTCSLCEFIRDRLAEWPIERICASLGIKVLGEGDMVDNTTVVTMNAAGEVVSVYRPGIDVAIEKPAPEPTPEPEPKQEPEPATDSYTSADHEEESDGEIVWDDEDEDEEESDD